MIWNILQALQGLSSLIEELKFQILANVKESRQFFKWNKIIIASKLLLLWVGFTFERMSLTHKRQTAKCAQTVAAWRYINKLKIKLRCTLMHRLYKTQRNSLSCFRWFVENKTQKMHISVMRFSKIIHQCRLANPRKMIDFSDHPKNNTGASALNQRKYIKNHLTDLTIQK